MTAYCMKTDFSFFEDSRVYGRTRTEVHQKKGQYLTKLQIAQRLGGSENSEALRQAEVYCAMCGSAGLKDLLLLCG